MDLKQRIEQSPMSRAQIWIIGICVMLNMSDGYDVLALAFSATDIRDEFGLSGSQLGLLLSAALFGMAAGSMFVSQVADIIGRRSTILICTIVIAVGMGLAAFSSTFIMLLVLRVITGVTIGTLQACLNVVVSEYSSARRRPISLSFYTAGQPIGGVIGGVAAGFLLSQFDWRAVFLFGALLNLALIPLILTKLPESIDYLVSRKPADALGRINQILAQINQPPSDHMPESKPAPSAAGRWKDVFAGTNGLATLLVGTAFFMLMAGFYFANSWTPNLVVESGFEASDGVLAGTMFSFGGIFGAILFGPVAARFGVPKALAGTFLLAGVGFVAFASSLGMLPTALLSAAILGFLTSACMAGLFSIGPILYPADIRATAVGFIIGVGRIGAILSPIIIGALLDEGWSPNTLYYLFIIPMVIAAAAVIPLGARRFQRTVNSTVQSQKVSSETPAAIPTA